MQVGIIGEAVSTDFITSCMGCAALNFPDIYIYTIVGIDKMLLCQKAINCVVQCIRPVNFI